MGGAVHVAQRGRKVSGEWRVRLCIPGRDVVCGAGVLLPGGLILTCAHVVDSALGRSEADPSVPDRPVDVDFSAVGDLKPRPARVVPGGWFPPAPRSGDIAVLTLESGEPPPAARPAALAAGRGRSRGSSASTGIPTRVWRTGCGATSGSPAPVGRTTPGGSSTARAGAVSPYSRASAARGCGTRGCAASWGCSSRCTGPGVSSSPGCSPWAPSPASGARSRGCSEGRSRGARTARMSCRRASAPSWRNSSWRFRSSRPSPAGWTWCRCCVRRSAC
ncbi:hypothetical protein CXR04_06915 [Streptomyces sp. CMB-StM0423]|nr:hypothetical protein CXR04_06915 [Streptomyces sp. CMB-StM0423]